MSETAKVHQSPVSGEPTFGIGRRQAFLFAALGLVALGLAMALWLHFGDAVFIERVIAALANCF